MKHELDGGSSVIDDEMNESGAGLSSGALCRQSREQSCSTDGGDVGEESIDLVNEPAVAAVTSFAPSPQLTVTT